MKQVNVSQAKSGIALYGEAIFRIFFASWKDTVTTRSFRGSSFLMVVSGLMYCVFDILLILSRVLLMVTFPISAFLVIEADRSLAKAKQRASDKLDAQFQNNRNH